MPSLMRITAHSCAAVRWPLLRLRIVLEQRQRAALGRGDAEWFQRRPDRASLYRALDSRRGRRGRSAGFRCALYDNRCAAAGFPPRTSVISSISLLWLLLSLFLLFIPLRFKPSHADLFLQSNPSPSFSMCAAHHQHATAALTSKPIDDGSAGSAASAAPAAYMSQLPSELLPSLLHVIGWFIVFITLCCICSL